MGRRDSPQGTEAFHWQKRKKEIKGGTWAGGAAIEEERISNRGREDKQYEEEEDKRTGRISRRRKGSQAERGKRPDGKKDGGSKGREI